MANFKIPIILEDVDLYGRFLINGSVAPSNKTIVYDEGKGKAEWNSVFVDLPPDLVFNKSNNSIVVNSYHNDSVKNGNNLIEAYLVAEQIASIIDASPSNRVSILLMPGDYYIFNKQLTLDISFIDLIGLAGTSRSTIIRSNQLSTIVYNSVDSKLENIDLRTSASLAFSQIGDCYLRWNNIIVSGNGFWDGGSQISCQNLRGEFTNILVRDSCNFAVANDSIDGIFTEIEFENLAGYGFFSLTDGQIQGTFSKVLVNSVNLPFFSHINTSDYEIRGTFTDFIIKDGYSNIFNSGGTLSGNYENFHINSPSSPTIFYSSKTLAGNFKNINISETTAHLFLGDKIDAEFDNVNIQPLNSQIFYSYSPVGSIKGTFSKIDIGPGNSSLCLVIQDGLIDITCKEFFIQSSNYFIYGSGTFSLDLEDIQIPNSNFTLMSDKSIVGNFKNITLENAIESNFYSTNGHISGNFDNINIFELQTDKHSFYGKNGIFGNFSNIEIQSTDLSYSFNSTELISGHYTNIFIYGSKGSFYTSGTLSCNIKTLHLDNTKFTSHLYGANGIIGNFENISILDDTFSILSTDVNAGLGDINVNVKDLFVSRIFTHLLYCNGDLIGNFENIKIKDFDGNFVRSNAGNIDGNFESIVLGDAHNPPIVTNLFSANGFVHGTFSDIIFGNTHSVIFQTNPTSTFSGLFKDLYIPRQGTGETFVGGIFDSSTIFDNVQCFNNIATFSGRMINSELGFPESTNSLPILPDGGVLGTETSIENSDFIYGEVILGGPSASIKSGNDSDLNNVQILYSAFLNGLAPSDVGGTPTNVGVTALEPNFNLFGTVSVVQPL